MTFAGRPALLGWSISLLLVASGLSASGYLLARTFALLAPSGRATADLCSALFSASCDHALADPRYWILDVPLAGWGIVYFSTLAVLLLLGRFLRGSFETDALLASIALTSAGVGVGLFLTATALLGHEPLCPVCLAIHAVNLALLGTLLRTLSRPLREQVRLWREALAWLLRPGTGTSESTRWKLVGFLCTTLLACLAYQWVFVESALRIPKRARATDRAEVLAAYRASPPETVPVSEQDPHLGPLGAPVQLVVFESFRCPHCQRLSTALAKLQHRFRDRLLVVYKHYPLSNRCNDRLRADLQPGACEIAWAAEAAHRQSRFWPFHDAIVAAGADASERQIWDAVRRLGLDPVRFEADWVSDSARARVAGDVALGNRLGIPGTPAAFLNGRRVPAATAEVLDILVRHELTRVPTGGSPTERAMEERSRPRRGGRPSAGG